MRPSGRAWMAGVGATAPWAAAAMWTMDEWRVRVNVLRVGCPVKRSSRSEKREPLPLADMGGVQGRAGAVAENIIGRLAVYSDTVKGTFEKGIISLFQDRSQTNVIFETCMGICRDV